MATGSFLNRFVHPRLAAVAIGGAALWGGSFLVAAVGVVLRRIGEHAVVSAELFFLSGLLGLLGMAILALCGLWLVGVRVRQTLGNQRI